MTCVVVALSADRVHIFADTAHLGPLGRLSHCAPKIKVFPKRRFAVVARGATGHSFGLGFIGRLCSSYDDARTRLPRLLCGPLGWLLRLLGPFELYVGGIGARSAPAAFLLVSHRKHQGVEPWRAIDIPYAVSTGPSPDVDPRADPVAFGVRAAELQRGVLQRLPFARRPVSIVGGALEHVEIAGSGVQTRTLGGWFDRLGERLNPVAKFSRSGAKIRKAVRLNLAGFLLPRTPGAMLRNCLIAYAAFVAARVAAVVPAAIYVERTYHAAPHIVVETSAGAWDSFLRLDLGKLITSPTLGRETGAAATGRKSRAADEADAARIALIDVRRDCTIISSHEVMRDEYEHTVECR